MLDRAGGGQAARRPDRRGQPAARGRAARASRTRSGLAAWSGGGTALADLFLQIRVGGDLALSRRSAGRCSRPRTRHPARSSTRTSSHGTPTASTTYADARSRALDWDDALEPRPGCTPERDRGGSRRIARGSQRIIVCWAMGLTQHKHAVRDDPRDRQLPAAARQHRPARRRRLPGARALQRPGRPHHGHLRSGRPPRSSTRSAPSSASSRRAHHGYDTVDAIRAMRDGHGEGLLRRWAATSSPPRPTPTSPRPRCGAAGSPSQVSTKLNRSHAVTGETGADPADPRPHRRDVQSRRRAVRHGRGLDGHGARLPRPARARLDAPAAARCAIVCRLARATLGDRDPASHWDAFDGRLRPDPRPHRAGGARVRRTSTSGCARPAASPCRTRRATSGASRHRHRAGQLHRQRARLS